MIEQEGRKKIYIPACVSRYRELLDMEGNDLVADHDKKNAIIMPRDWYYTREEAETAASDLTEDHDRWAGVVEMTVSWSIPQLAMESLGGDR